MIKKKKWLSICLVICLIGGIGGAAWYRQKKIEERRMSLVYIPKVEDSTNDFWKALILGTKMAAKEYNADIEIKAPTEENDIERQNKLLKEAISEEPDAILFSPSSFTESNDLLKEAKEKGIRISFIDSYTEEKVQDLTVATDNLEAGEKLGFLPGDLQSKIDPYLRPLYDALYQIMGAESFLKNSEKGLIEVAPLAYMRGRTLDNAFIILDEAQNTTPAQMKMFLTRIGFGSKVVITGDETQKDLPSGQTSGLDVAVRVVGKINDIGVCRLTSKDVVRHPLVQKIVKAYEEYETKTQNKSRNRSREKRRKS